MFLNKFKNYYEWSSSPLVKLMRGWNTLVLPQVGGIKVHRLWVSSSESLSDPCVMKLLSVTELQESAASSNESSEHESAEALMKVNVEIVWSSFLTAHEVGECEPSTEESEGSSFHSTDELEVVVEIEEVKVEQLWVVLDKLNWSNFLTQLTIFFFDVLWVTVNAWTVTSHFLFIKFYN